MKKYSINVEEDEIVSIEIDGAKYKSADDIPDPEDREWMSLLTSTSPFIEPGALAAEPFGPPKIITPLFLTIAILMWVIAIAFGVRTGQILSREVSAPGHVVELIVRRDERGREFSYPLVAFDLPGSGRQRVQITEGSWPPAYKVDQQVTILYDPQRPTEARIASTGGTIGRWTVSIITGILAIAFSGATLFARWILKSDET